MKRASMLLLGLLLVLIFFNGHYTRAVNHGTQELADRAYAQAIPWYHQALASRPAHIPALHGLGEALLQQGQPAEAHPYLEHAWHQAPDRATLQIALAHAALAADDQEPTLDAVVHPTNRERLADRLFLAQNYAAAAAQYANVLHATSAASLAAVQFKQAVAQVLAGSTAAQLAHVTALPARSTPYWLNGNQFRWMVPHAPEVVSGDTLERAPPPAHYGWLWWPGHALAIVDIETAGHYRIVAQVEPLHPPASVAIGVHDIIYQQQTIQEQSGTWHTLAFTVELAAGLTTVDIWLTDDDEQSTATDLPSVALNRIGIQWLEP